MHENLLSSLEAPIRPPASKPFILNECR